jgi:undecaprenyl-phosphate galactose phosphotransferase
VILLGNKYKLLDEDVEELKKSFSSYYQVDADDSSIEKLNDIIQSDTQITTIVLNLEKELSSVLKDFLEELEYKHKVETLLFSDFTSKYLNQCQLEINEENLKTLLEIQNNTLNRVIKRIFDVGFSLFAIFISSPVMLGIAILIKLKSPEGGVFFTQKRLGFRGDSFRVFKFRTMVPNAEAILEDMLEKDEEIRNEYIKYRKLKNDPRIIPVIGNFLRKSSLDELPQFFNVLLGDMSVVGPRPYIKEEFYKHTQTHIDIITSVKPGVTGYWQVTDRNAATFNGRVDSDIEYVKNQNLVLDIKIIFQTVMVMVFRKGS